MTRQPSATAVTDYVRIEAAIRYVAQNVAAQPSLSDIAAHAGFSPYHFQRLFKRWAGVSPKRFLQFLTASYAAQALRQSRGMLEAAFDSGLSSGGRLHDLFVSLHAVTPGEYREQGAGLTLRYGRHPTPFGDCLIGMTERGICALSFTSDDPQTDIAVLADTWPRARLIKDFVITSSVIKRLFKRSRTKFPLHVQGTNFQIKVWEALLRISPGHVVSYSEVARTIGCPQSVRAVANAIGANPVALLIPCHRVIRETAQLGGYRWGPHRKTAILAWEGLRARSHRAADD